MLSNDPDKPYEARFLTAKCPIVENLKLPKHKRNKDYALYQFCDVKDCPALKRFKQNINLA